MSLNLVECVAWSAEATPDNTALIIGKLRLSYGELYAAVKRMSRLLENLGIKPGDRVAIMLPNVPQFVIIYHGILHRGATVVSANPMLRARELHHYMELSETKALFVWHECLAEASVAAARCSQPPMIISVESGFAPEPPAVGHSFLALMAESEPAGDMALTRPEDLAVIQYTSALEGVPRGAQLSHFNLWHNAHIISEKVLRYYPEDVCLAVLPFFHAFGQTTMMNAALMSRSSVVLAPRFETSKIFETIARESVTLLAMVPTMFHMLTDHKASEAPDLSSLRAVITGGAPMPQHLADAFTERYNIPILEGYGLTETSPVVAFNHTIETSRPGSVGVPIYGCRIRILREDNEDAAIGEIGEVVVRGPNVMQGYLKDSAATAASFHEGWFRTGDYGYLDADGYLFLTGLKKDMIIRAGMNVYPREVERILTEHPAVAECAVIGTPDRLRGQEVKAFVVAEEGQSPAEKELSQFCREHLAAYKCPKRFELISALPRTADGQVDKAQLQAGFVDARPH